MDRWKSRDGKSQRREEKKKEDQKKRPSEKNRDSGARKGRKLAKHCVFPMICGVFNILTWKFASRHHGVDFFRHVNFQKWSANGAFCTFWLRHVLRATTACTFSTSQLPKVVRNWCALYILTWKCASRHNGVQFHLSSDQLAPHVHFWTFRCRFAWQAQGIAHLVKNQQNVRVLWHFQKRWQAWDFWRRSASISRGRRSTRDISIRHVSKGADFLRGAAFWSIRSSGLLRWFDFAWQVQHFVWSGITFSWQAQHFTQMAWKNRKTHLVRGRRLCTQLSIVEGSLTELLRFWCCQLVNLRTSRRIASFLMLSSSKIEEVSPNCFVFDVVKFKKWGKVSQNCCVFDVVKFNNWGSLAE